MLRIKGFTKFYEGWIAQVLQSPLDPNESEDWQHGWRIGQETGDDAALSIPAEIRLKHIIVMLDKRTEREDRDEEIMQLVREKYEAIYIQRETILEAFIAETGFKPSEVVQIEQKTPTGSIWYVTKKESSGEAVSGEADLDELIT